MKFSLSWLFKTGSTAILTTLLFFVNISALPGEIFVIAGGIINVMSYIALKRGAENSLVSRCFLYRFIRHPMYFGEMILGIGLALIVSAPLGWFFLSIQIVSIIILIHTEDLDLEKRFGDDFLEWKKGTQKLIPFIW